MKSRNGEGKSMNRRKFLKTGLSVTAGAALVGAAAHPTWASANPRYLPMMRFLAGWRTCTISVKRTATDTACGHEIRPPNAEYILQKFQNSD